MVDGVYGAESQSEVGGVMSRTLAPTRGSRARLNEWERRRALQRILEHQRRLVAVAPAGRPVGPDLLEAAQEQEGEMVWLAIMDQSRDIQIQVEEAWRRLTEGEYGRCADCDGPIPMARLRALPFALRCLTCQERYETARGRAALVYAASVIQEDG
jgi:DnaK suppressor protein